MYVETRSATLHSVLQDPRGLACHMQSQPEQLTGERLLPQLQQHQQQRPG